MVVPLQAPTGSYLRLFIGSFGLMAIVGATIRSQIALKRPPEIESKQ